MIEENSSNIFWKVDISKYKYLKQTKKTNKQTNTAREKRYWQEIHCFCGLKFPAIETTFLKTLRLSLIFPQFIIQLKK